MEGAAATVACSSRTSLSRKLSPSKVTGIGMRSFAIVPVVGNTTATRCCNGTMSSEILAPWCSGGVRGTEATKTR